MRPETQDSGPRTHACGAGPGTLHLGPGTQDPGPLHVTLYLGPGTLLCRNQPVALLGLVFYLMRTSVRKELIVRSGQRYNQSPSNVHDDTFEKSS